MSEEDEVHRRAQVAATARAAIVAEREERARLTAEHEAEMQTGLSDLLEAVSQEVADQTSTPFFLTEDEIICYVQVDGATKHHILFRAQLSSDLTDDIDDTGWELTYRCQSRSTLDAAEDFRGEDRYDLPFDEAVEFGREAVLDGMAVLIATGQVIVDPDAVQAPPEPPAVSEHAIASSPRAVPNTLEASVRKPGMMGPVLAVLAMAFLLIWGLALLARPAP